MLWNPLITNIEHNNKHEYNSFYNFNLLKMNLEWNEIYIRFSPN